MNKKNLLIILAVVVLLIAAYMLWPKKKTLGLPTDQSGSGGSTGLGNSGSATGGSAIPAATGANNSIFPLKQGARGNEVKNIQRAINANNTFYGGLGYAQLTEDGIYGPKTAAALDKIFAADSGFVTQGRYDYIMSSYLAGRPIQKSNDNFPLQLTSYGDKVRQVNIALGLYPSNTKDAKAYYFTQATRAQLYGKHQRNVVDEKLYGHLMEISSTNPGLLGGLVFMNQLI